MILLLLDVEFYIVSTKLKSLIYCVSVDDWLSSICGQTRAHRCIFSTASWAIAIKVMLLLSLSPLYNHTTNRGNSPQPLASVGKKISSAKWTALFYQFITTM